MRKLPLCTYCRREMGCGAVAGLAVTRDHVIPRSKGGTYTVPCCRACNCLKSNMMPAEWGAFMAANPKWWKLSPVTRPGRPKRVRRPRPAFRPYSGFPSFGERPDAIPATLPVEYDDAETQAGFACAYAGRVHMLRVARPSPDAPKDAGSAP